MDNVTRRNAIKVAATAGLATVTASAASADDRKPADSGRKDMWRAWATTGGTETKLVIEGIYQGGGPGLVAVLKPVVPQGFNPKILTMELTLATLPGMWATIITPVPACYVQTPYKKGQYESIQVHYPDGHVEDIKGITDAGDGPKAPAKKDR
ncbi:hypothetical protein BH11PLA2_BH11PLA2_01920 [soil metagenome]